jgi:hypothetical protein
MVEYLSSQLQSNLQRTQFVIIQSLSTRSASRNLPILNWAPQIISSPACYHTTGWAGSSAIMKRINIGLNYALQDPNVIDALVQLGFDGFGDDITEAIFKASLSDSVKINYITGLIGTSYAVNKDLQIIEKGNIAYGCEMLAKDLFSLLLQFLLPDYGGDISDLTVLFGAFATEFAYGFFVGYQFA